MKSKTLKKLAAHAIGISLLTISVVPVTAVVLPNCLNTFFPEAHLVTNFFDPNRDIFYSNLMLLFTREGIEAVGSMLTLKVFQWYFLTAPFGKIFGWLPWKNKKRLMLTGLVLCFYELLLIVSVNIPTEFELSDPVMSFFVLHSLLLVLFPFIIYGLALGSIQMYKDLLNPIDYGEILDLNRRNPDKD